MDEETAFANDPGQISLGHKHSFTFLIHSDLLPEDQLARAMNLANVKNLCISSESPGDLMGKEPIVSSASESAQSNRRMPAYMGASHAPA